MLLRIRTKPSHVRVIYIKISRFHEMLFIPGKITIFSSPSLLLLFFFTISFIFYELTKPANLFLGVYSIFLSLSFSLSLSLSVSLFIFVTSIS